MASPPTIEVHGTVAPGFEPVRDAFAANFDRGEEIGACFAGTVDGRFVVDIWAGHRDAARTLPWEEDTIVNVFSTTKATVATAVAMLADRGLLDYSKPVAYYWPEFAQNGKAEITVAQALSHQGGVPGITRKLPNWYDWDAIVDALAAETPWWEPGTANGYHAITFGHLAGEIIRRVSGKSFGEFLATEIAKPLQADFLCGFGPEEDHRVGEMVPPAAMEGIPPDALLLKVLANPPFDSAQANDREWRAAQVPAANGHANARSCARVMSALACGGEVDGVPILSQQAIDSAITEQCYRDDLVLLLPMRWGVGFMLNSEHMPVSPNARTFGHGGAGGSLAFADLDARASFAYVMNKMGVTTTGDMRGATCAMAFHQCVKGVADP
jgi:CubicO group peptidase (beta-lactamase class C family)